MRLRTNLHSNNVHYEKEVIFNTERASALTWPMPTLSDLQTKLDGVRREVRNLTVMGLDPNQTPEQAALIEELERSARAEMRLRTRALAHAKGHQRSQNFRLV